MGHVLEAIHVLEKTFIPKESLEETRLGKLVNDIRKKSADRELTNRCRKLVRQWQKQHLKNSNGSSNSPQANQRTPPSSAGAVASAPASNPASSESLSLVQEGAPSQPSVDKTNPANRKRRKAETSSPREGQPSAKLVKSSKVHDSNGIPREGKTVKSGLKKTNENKNKHVGLASHQKLSKSGQSVSNLSPSISKRTSSPNVNSLENAKRLPKVKSSNSLGIAEGSKSAKSSPGLLKPETTKSPSSALGRLKASPKSRFSPKISNTLKDGKRNNVVSPAFASVSHPRRKEEKTSAAPPMQSIFDDDSKVKTKSIFDDDEHHLYGDSSLDRSLRSDEKFESSSRTHSLFDEDGDVANDSTIYMKSNQDTLEKNSLLFSSKHVDNVSHSQTFVDTESNINALRTSPPLESKMDTCLTSCSMKQEHEGTIQRNDISEEPVRIVTEGEIDRIHTTHWSGVNGCYDLERQWHGWSSGYSIPHENSGDNALHILPYVCLD
ncbi:mediator of RNA polymerase II transcription subunit 26-like isoform X2 [Anneissia japonica]|nr:mediator of RNA polymerase II transcription subunit 26-like isoform X2 [Anneissia japonica]